MDIRFLHIPKTAGTTFTALLKKKFPANTSFTLVADVYQNKIIFNNLTQDVRDNIHLFIGHAPLKTGIEKADDAITLTFLRNPVNRVQSFCQHVFEGKSSYLKSKFPPSNFNLDKFLDSNINELSNLQCKLLSFRYDCNSLFNNDHDFLENTRDEAIDNLNNKINFFGIQEYFDLSVITIFYQLGWPIIHYLPSNFKSPFKTLHFNNSQIEKIIKLNKYDIDLYCSAHKIFLANLNSNKIDMRTISRFKKIQKILNPIGKLYSSYKYM